MLRKKQSHGRAEQLDLKSLEMIQTYYYSTLRQCGPICLFYEQSSPKQHTLWLKLTTFLLAR